MVWLGVAAGLGSGILLWLSSPAVGAGWVAWVALVPAAAATLGWRDSRPGRLAMPLAYAVYLELMLVPALPFGLTDGQFGTVPVPVLIGGTPVLLVAIVAVPLLGAVLYALRFGQALAPWSVRVPAPWSAALLVASPALAFTALDVARVKLDPGGLFGPLFASQHDMASARLAALGGPWLLTFAIAAAGYALALLLVRGRRLLAAGGAALLLAAGGMAEAAGPPGGGGTLAVAAIQPGYDTSEDDRPELRFFTPGRYHLAALDTISDLGALTTRAADGGADLVVWPEAALWVDPARTPAVRRALARLAARAGASIVVPYFLRDARQGAAIVVSPTGAISTPRPKQRPMWFLGEDGGNKAPARPVRARSVVLGTSLGVDSQDPGLAARLARAGASVLVSSTHDWKQMAGYHRALAQLHAAAADIPVIRADWRYGSAIYDAGGRRVADAGTANRRTVVAGRVSPAAGSSPYATIGDALGWTALAITVLVGVATALTRRKSADRTAREARRSTRFR